MNKMNTTAGPLWTGCLCLVMAIAAWAGSDERRYELEKARLAQSSGKLPSKDFNVAQFEEQAAQSQQKYDQARARADKQQAETSRLEQAYAQLASSRPQT